MTFTAGKNVAYQMPPDVPNVENLFSFDNISVSRITNVRIDKNLEEVIDYEIRFGVSTSDFISTQKKSNFTKIYNFKVKIYAGKILASEFDVPSSSIIDRKDIIQEVMVPLTIKKDILDESSGTIDLVISCVGKNKSNIPGLNVLQRLDYVSDKQRYFIPNSAVNITASPASRTSMLVTIINSNRTNVAGAKIYRREVNSKSGFTMVKLINFQNTVGTRIGSGCEVSFIDDGNSFGGEESNGAGVLNSFLSYEYRCVSFGFEGVEGGRYSKFITVPLTSNSILFGEDVEILSVPNASAYGLVDHNIFPYGKIPKNFENTSVVSQVTREGILVSVGNIPKNFIGSIVRKNITAGERNFSRLKDEKASGYIGSDQPGSYNFVDSAVIDGSTYQYGCELFSLAGSTSLAADTSTMTYVNLSLRDIPGVTTKAMVVQKNEFGISFNIKTYIPVNEIDATVRTLQDRGLLSSFSQDLSANRSNLQNSFGYKVIKMNLTTGQENTFISNDNSVTNFRENSSDKDKVSVVKSLMFYDSDVVSKNEYRYIVVTLMRDIEQIFESQISIVDETNSYIFFPAKYRHPLVLRKGILPPTKPGKFYELGLIKNENTNPVRLLSRTTALSEFELGEISARAFIPDQASSIILPAGNGNKLNVQPAVLKTSSPSTIAKWTMIGIENIDYFMVKIIDTFFNKSKKKIAERIDLLPPFSNDERNKFKSENIINRFNDKATNNDEIITFNDVAENQILSSTAKVSRIYEITPVYFDGSFDLSQTTKPVDVTKEVTR